MKALVSLAVFLSRIRFVVWAAAVAAAGWFAYELFGQRPSELGALPALTLLLWAVLLLGISYVFPAGPPAIAASDRAELRWRKRVSQALYWFLAVVTIGVTVLVAYLTERAVGLALG